ncbi:hypothetical protein [Pedobacter sp. Hv1]|uniref:hypothetical protein n=1 Tax=Pedobacter sp. Hv1 TaxID=1740090 RepID=UPI00128F6DD6|nr:hypothetical protein [Pedobacter sp. Hv1]
MKILILSSTPWRDDNSFGDSYSNIFGNIKEIEIANIYCSMGLPNNSIASHFFQMSEKKLLLNLIDKENKTGDIVLIPNRKDNELTPVPIATKEQKIFRFFQKNRYMVFMWAREIIWFLGRWKSKELNKFIDDFNPDLIFTPIYINPYMNRIGLYVKKYSGKKMLGYVSDDVYTLRQFSINPFFWIDRLVNRFFVKKVVDQCDLLYVISDIQKKDYDVCFNKDCHILFKGGNFDVIPVRKPINTPVKLLYTGNIGAGRYKSLALIGEALDKINEDGVKAILTIYSQTPLNKKKSTTLLNFKSLSFRGGISQEEVKIKQQEADVLIYVESFDLREKLMVRQSFSTKIVDYLRSAKCIFAVGSTICASIDYLIDNDAAIVATHKNEIEVKLTQLIKSPEKLINYGYKAWQCGKKNHQIEDIQATLLRDFNQILNK